MRWSRSAPGLTEAAASREVPSEVSHLRPLGSSFARRLTSRATKATRTGITTERVPSKVKTAHLAEVVIALLPHISLQPTGSLSLSANSG